MINQVTNGLTQKTVPATELGYSLTISFGGYISDGSYKEVRNGIPARNGSFSAVSSESGSIKDVLRYPADTTQQSFDLRDTIRTDSKKYHAVVRLGVPISTIISASFCVIEHYPAVVKTAG